MVINEAKSKLYDDLRNKFVEVVGAGVRERNGNYQVVIYLSHVTNDVLASIPQKYEGYDVNFEIVGYVRPL